MSDLKLDLIDFDLNLELFPSDDEILADLVAFAEMLEQQWHELLAEQSTLALL